MHRHRTEVGQEDRGVCGVGAQVFVGLCESALWPRRRLVRRPGQGYRRTVVRRRRGQRFRDSLVQQRELADAGDRTLAGRDVLVAAGGHHRDVGADLIGGVHRAVGGFDALEELPGGCGQFVGERLDVPTAAGRVENTADARLVLQDQLGVARHTSPKIPGQGCGGIERRQGDRIGSAHHGPERGRCAAQDVDPGIGLGQPAVCRHCHDLGAVDRLAHVLQHSRPAVPQRTDLGHRREHVDVPGHLQRDPGSGVVHPVVDEGPKIQKTHRKHVADLLRLAGTCVRGRCPRRQERPHSGRVGDLHTRPHLGIHRHFAGADQRCHRIQAQRARRFHTMHTTGGQQLPVPVRGDRRMRPRPQTDRRRFQHHAVEHAREFFRGTDAHTLAPAEIKLHFDAGGSVGQVLQDLRVGCGRIGVHDAGADVPLAVLARGGVGSPGQRVETGEAGLVAFGWIAVVQRLDPQAVQRGGDQRAIKVLALEHPVHRGQPLFAGGTVVRRKIQVLSHASRIVRRTSTAPRVPPDSHLGPDMTEGRQPQLPSP